METKSISYSHNIFTEKMNEYGLDTFIVSDWGITSDDKLVTHIAINEFGEGIAISCERNDKHQFWKFKYEKVFLTLEQWEKIVEFFNFF